MVSGCPNHLVAPTFLKSSSFPHWSVIVAFFINQVSFAWGGGWGVSWERSVDGFDSDSLVNLSNLVAILYNPEYYNFRKRS